MKKKNVDKCMKEIGTPISIKNVEIKHSKEFKSADKELTSCLNKMPITQEQNIEILVFISKLLIHAETGAYIQGLSDGFDRGADWMKEFMETTAKENAIRSASE